MAKKENLIIDQGSIFLKEFSSQVKHANGTPINFDNWNISAKMKESYDSLEAFSFDSLGTNNGYISISMSSIKTGLLEPGRYVYDIEAWQSIDDVERIFEGQVTVTPSVDGIEGTPLNSGFDTNFTSGGYTSAEAGSSIIVGQALTINTLGKLVPASPNDLTHAGQVVGLSIFNSSIGQTTYARYAGILSVSGWNWTPGDSIFIGANGFCSNTPGNFLFVQQVGYAISNTDIVVKLSDPIILS